MIRPGRSLERLIASIEKALAGNDDIKVEAPKRLRDKTTGALREHDVVVTATQGHHSVQIAIECRDRARPVTVNQVESFWTKCQDTGVHQGIIVSPTGFYVTAKKKAEHWGIRCLSIEQIDSFPWLAIPGLSFFSKRIVNTHWEFLLDTDQLIDQENIEILDPQGNTVNKAVLTANAREQLGKLLPDPLVPTNAGELRVKFEGNGLSVRDKQSGRTVAVRAILATINYVITQELIPFRMVQYVDQDKGAKITDAAVADLNLGEYSGKFVIVYDSDKGAAIYIVPEDKA
jgi:hypothetical protein